MRRATRAPALAAVASVLAFLMAGSASAQLQAEGEATTMPSAVDAVVTSMGADLESIVRQTGLLNYAGPNCPGVAWNCTTATQVVQVALPGGTNVVECGDPALVGLDPATIYGTVPAVPYSASSAGTCLAVQLVSPITSGSHSPTDNHGRCHLREHQRTDPAVFAQKCRIVQISAGGNNRASVHMLIDQHAQGTNQEAVQQAEVIQQNTTGPNHSQVTQIIKQSTNDKTTTASPIVQDQNAFQSVCVWQGGPATPPTGDSDCPDTAEQSTGNNFSQIHQSEFQSEKASGAPSSHQDQNTADMPAGFDDCNPDGAFVTNPNICAEVDQHSLGGRLESFLDQSIDQDQRTDSETGTQTQGRKDAGIDGRVFQSPNAGRRTSHPKETEHQNQVAPGPGVAQTQDGPMDCCSTQPPPGSPTDSVNIDQRSVQKATISSEPLSTTALATANPAAKQETLLIGRCETTGDCVVTHTTKQNDDAETHRCPPEGVPIILQSDGGAPACFLVTFCQNGECTAVPPGDEDEPEPCPEGTYRSPFTGECEPIIR